MYDEKKCFIFNGIIGQSEQYSRKQEYSLEDTELKLWITAGGTGSAWHIATIAKKFYSDKIELFISDINEAELVASSTLADHFFKVLPVKDPKYAEQMYRLLKENQIDVIIPLIPWEQKLFSSDNPEFEKLKIKSLAPALALDKQMNNKKDLFLFCKDKGIPVIQNYEWKDIEKDTLYFVKPADGFGAMGTGCMYGRELTPEMFEDYVVQENCAAERELEEVTVEVFWHEGKVHSIARQRIESKNGVCTKARILDIPETEEAIWKMVQTFDFPKIFNVQFVHHENQWKVMDVNLRLAAGTGLSNAAGFQLVRSLLAVLLDEEPEAEWLSADKEIISILRVYQEVVIK